MALDKEYGIPSQRKFPLDSRAHVMSAIRFFNYADPVYRKQLAEAIIKKLHQYNITGLTPSDNNSFYKYYTPPVKHSESLAGIVVDDDFLEHYGVKGMKWDVRRYQNSDGSLTSAGKKHYSYPHRTFRSASTGFAVAGVPGAVVGSLKSAHRQKRGKSETGTKTDAGRAIHRWNSRHPVSSSVLKVAGSTAVKTAISAASQALVEASSGVYVRDITPTVKYNPSVHTMAPIEYTHHVGYTHN